MSAITLYAMGWLRSSHHLRSLQEKLSLRRSQVIWCSWPFLFVPWDQWRLKYTEVQSQQMAFTQSPSLSNSPMIFTNYLICTVLLEDWIVTIASFGWWLRTIEIWPLFQLTSSSMPNTNVRSMKEICLGRGVSIQQTSSCYLWIHLFEY